MMWKSAAERAQNAERDLTRVEEALRKEARSLEMCANLMRDRSRYPASHREMADKVADSFDRACRRLRAALMTDET